jgi:uncharacterized membrane protein
MTVTITNKQEKYMAKSLRIVIVCPWIDLVQVLIGFQNSYQNG